ncbi:MAG: proliferating cell nuclear antigen (pcna) [Nanoarchaeota archaeon]|nr:proliferating cell nuclear antigen (pcna) [Nanoarchaeota archaeon]
MKLTLAESRLLKEPISIISELVSEVSFKIDKEKVELVAMDPANVVMVVFKLLSSAFVEYEISKDENISLSLDNLNQVFRRIKPSDTLILELDEEKNRLKVRLRGNTNRTFNLSLLNLEEKENKVPDLNFPLKIETNSGVFEDAIEDASIVADSVAFIAAKDKFLIKSEGNVSDANVEMITDEETDIKMENDDKIGSKYSIEYLKKIVKGGKLADRVHVQFNKDYPLKIDYNLMDKLGLTFILAPRVSND